MITSKYHEDSTVRVIDAFVDELDLRKLGFDRADPAATGRPAYHPATLLKIYVYGYLNRVQSSRRLETEAQLARELRPKSRVCWLWRADQRCVGGIVYYDQLWFSTSSR